MGGQSGKSFLGKLFSGFLLFSLVSALVLFLVFLFLLVVSPIAAGILGILVATIPEVAAFLGISSVITAAAIPWMLGIGACLIVGGIALAVLMVSVGTTTLCCIKKHKKKQVVPVVVDGKKPETLSNESVEKPKEEGDLYREIIGKCMNDVEGSDKISKLVFCGCELLVVFANCGIYGGYNKDAIWSRENKMQVEAFFRAQEFAGTPTLIDDFYVILIKARDDVNARFNSNEKVLLNNLIEFVNKVKEYKVESIGTHAKRQTVVLSAQGLAEALNQIIAENKENDAKKVRLELEKNDVDVRIEAHDVNVHDVQFVTKKEESKLNPQAKEVTEQSDELKQLETQMI